MNNKRREEINNAIEKLNSVYTDINRILDDEQDSYDNLTPGLQATARGEKSEESIGLLSDASDNLSDCIDILNSILY